MKTKSIVVVSALLWLSVVSTASAQLTAACWLIHVSEPAS